MVCIPSHSFDKNLKLVSERSWFNNQVFLKTANKISEICHRFSSKRFVTAEFENKDLPLDIKKMLSLQNENIETVCNQMQMYWRTPITEVIRDNLNAKFNFYQTEIEE